MNLLLLTAQDFINPTTAMVCDRRYTHLMEIHKVSPGSQVRVGLINGLQGDAIVSVIDGQRIELSVHVDQPAPPPLPLTLVVALPRPKMLKRIFQTIATMGVKELILINSYRVEKSYWQTPWLTEEKINEQLILGLEQGVDTTLPSVRLIKRFKPFVEDELPGLCQGKRALVAHPKQAVPCPQASNQETVLVIGPEGGFIDYEIDKLNQAGCKTIHLGPRILRVETAVPVLLAKLFNL
ncbi:16S rRNA (uracil(1498)-N(3))-methyltransferase [Aestuariicella hydrocarbonica]|uniref:Ribosomal RNA small subunit methyltransferase E n=1 Tax=Pseudomaricurvus hydrocarbonicus TaxID=1470433 RepID=A0A9E5MMP6_9GAMM|nr:16S rRNA (uracil(1498)-N(3))-methyltransferase [Aestuariicella hydrocarbonica]NHO67074.1 16S rRNA (uracil(1498)-N(3))-methyltransferase [Aestuariicella hydrocarbonica]